MIRYVAHGQLLKQVSMTNGVECLAYIQIYSVQLMMDSKHIGQKDQQLLCCRSILHEPELGWVYLAGNMID